MIQHKQLCDDRTKSNSKSLNISNKHQMYYTTLEQICQSKCRGSETFSGKLYTADDNSMKIYSMQF